MKEEMLHSIKPHGTVFDDTTKYGGTIYTNGNTVEHLFAMFLIDKNTNPVAGGRPCFD